MNSLTPRSVDESAHPSTPVAASDGVRLRRRRLNRLGCRFRVTNGHRAAICGLMLAGLTFREACSVVGAPVNSMRELIGPDWRGRIVRPRKWKGDLLKDLEEMYREPSWTLKRIGALLGISPANICKMAIENGWPPRLRSTPRLLPPMTARQRLDYEKIKGEGIPRAEALRAVLEARA